MFALGLLIPAVEVNRVERKVSALHFTGHHVLLGVCIRSLIIHVVFFGVVRASITGILYLLNCIDGSVADHFPF